MIFKRLLPVLILFFSTQSYAAKVLVSNNLGSYTSGLINDFYNSLDGVSSSSSGALDAGLDLYLTRPGSFFPTHTAANIINYLNQGGRVVLFSEHNGPGGGGSTFPNNALSLIGSSLRFLGLPPIDGGGHSDSSTAQVLDTPFTKNVSTLNYAAADGVGGGKPVFLASDLATPIIAYERFGKGTLIAIGDTNIADKLPHTWNDNSAFFENLLVANVPDHGTSASLLIIASSLLLMTRLCSKRSRGPR